MTSIAFETSGGAETTADNAGMALLLWERRHAPRPTETPELEEGEIGLNIRKIRLGTAREFLQRVESICERTWNTAPELPEAEEFDVQEASLNVLKWLRKYGDIVKLIINKREYLPE